ncbi:hypothetical protein [Sanguibacter antarcticus]|uniref:Tfp pilus assembly protein PilN n=1 Tax=Sanguibacter antarcticus TaxID=372484 RepID=A0A2A9E367_9MICO|nr:hypothetical protein [Sanguibacter antarcticus]PFG33096.1 hypothetical protein ATL42_0956 [Sanguibacter antarcticus]
MSTPKSVDEAAVFGGYQPVVAGAPPLPQVNLLPPSVRARRQLQRLKLVLLAVLVAVALLGIAIWLWTAALASTAQSDLETEQTLTTQLLREQAKYAEVPRVKGQIEDSKAARSLVTEPEIFWKSLTDEILAGLPAGVTVTDIDVSTKTPLSGTPVAPDAITDQGVATVTVNLESPTVLLTSDVLEMLDGIPGFMESTLTAETLGEDDELQPLYEVEATLQVDTTAYANRFKEAGEG